MKRISTLLIRLILPVVILVLLIAGGRRLLARKKAASLRAMGRSVVEIQYGDLRDISTSDYLFCLHRSTGHKQWTYKGKPLYLWIKDSKPGDRTGDGFNNAWRLARS